MQTISETKVLLLQCIPICYGCRCSVCPEHAAVYGISVSYCLPGIFVDISTFDPCRIFNALFLLYAVIQITEIKAIGADLKTGISHIPVGTLTTIIPIVIAVAELIYIGLAWKIYHEFGWKVYKFLGADRRIKQMFGYYQVFQCLVKFDVFFWIGFSVQFIWIVLEPGDWEYYVTCAALPLSIVLLVEGHLAARHENKWMMITFMTGCTSGLVYFVYKVSFDVLTPFSQRS